MIQGLHTKFIEKGYVYLILCGTVCTTNGGCSRAIELVGVNSSMDVTIIGTYYEALVLTVRINPY